MKKQLLFGAALFTAMSAFSQTGRISGGFTAGAVDARKENGARMSSVNETPVSPMYGSGQLNPSNNPSTEASRAVTTVNWSLLTGSSNTYGMLVNSQRPLSYNPALKAISFVHRKSDYYQESPAVPATAKTGVIVANVSTNFGQTWDSTCIWANGTNWGRYPQGGIYNPTGNTSLANAYVLGTGPTVAGSTWSGNFYASKKLNVFNNTPSTAPGGQVFFDFALPSYPAGQFSNGWTRNGFCSTDDGKVRAIGILSSDLQTLANVRGFAVSTATFNGTGFDWKMDSLMPPCVLDGAGDNNLNPDPQMAWNQNGTIGYVVGIGARKTATLSNMGMQPIIYKMDRTTNPAATWTLMPGIDFNAPVMRSVIASKSEGRYGMAPFNILGTDTVGVPFFSDMDIAVDANGKLHIAASFYSASSDHPDSLNFLSTYTTSINPSERYSWRHVNGSRPYLYDFYGDGTTFNKILVDSIASEGPGVSSGSRGYNDNQWDPSGTGGAKLNSDARLQLGRTPDGKHIIFSWVESDSLFTNNGFKWNNLPDIKTRAIAVHSGTNTNAYLLDLFGEQNLTGNDNNVRSRATLHYMSPIASDGTVTTTPAAVYSVNIFVPFSVTNSNPYSQLTNNATWFGAANVTYKFPKANETGIAENNTLLSMSTVYPNPARTSATVKVVLVESAALDVVVMNAVGQVVKSVKTAGTVGENMIRVDLAGLASGIYMVTIKADGNSTTKKLIVE